MRILWPKRSADFCEHCLVIDVPDTDDLKCFIPRIVFSVALFPDPILPKSTILISFAMSKLRKKDEINQYTVSYYA